LAKLIDQTKLVDVKKNQNKIADLMKNLNPRITIACDDCIFKINLSSLWFHSDFFF